MLRLKGGLVILMALCLSWGMDTYSGEVRKPARHSRLLLEGNKRYIEDIHWGEKRYVVDREEADAEMRRWLRWDKRYAGEESDGEFFLLETKALYRFTSLQKNKPLPQDAENRLAVVVDDGKEKGKGVEARREIEDREVVTKEREKINIPAIGR